ncbi:MAG TPA: HEAT repeat domain-containing protein, partial [Pirellulaceae bacterium]|nr:HEAT repeat domain-containing protein [Pirellulaceae bacterium]
VPQLIATLRGDDDEAKEMAADALGVLGPAADEAADVLRPLLASEAEGVADWSAIALGKIAGTDEALPRLMTIIRERQGRNIRVQAAEALGNIGPKARTALPLLHSALDDPDEDFRHAVEGAIAFIEDEV